MKFPGLMEFEEQLFEFAKINCIINYVLVGTTSGLSYSLMTVETLILNYPCNLNEDCLMFEV